MTEDNGRGMEDILPVGRVIKAHGIKGEVKVLPYSGSPENFTAYRRVMMTPRNYTDNVGPGRGEDEGQGRFYVVTRCRAQGKTAILKLAGVETRDEADALRGLEVWLKRNDLPGLAAGEFYWHDMIGMRVFDDEGGELGDIKSIFSTGAHDVLVVRGRGGEYLIPARHEFIVEVHKENNTLTVRCPPGLLDINLEKGRNH